MTVTIHHGDCREIIATLPDCSIDAIVTDPPYGLEFMGKEWDRPWAVSPANSVGYEGRDKLTLPSHRDSRNANCRACGGRQRGAKRCTCTNPQWDRHPAQDMVDFQHWFHEIAVDLFRVLKPGGHLLAFGGTRTYHRMTVAIEDAGFEIRDSIHWLYGSGFPKSLDVSKAIDKRGGVMPWQADFARHLRAVKPANVTTAQINAHVANGTKSNFWGHFIDTTSQPLLPTVEQYRRLQEIMPIDHEWDALFLPEAKREVVGATVSTTLEVAPGEGRERPQVVVDITAPATDAARQWEGWGTALKPAHEPIVVARKPLSGTVAANVMEHGTGALNIDGCRIGSDGGGTRCNNRDEVGKCQGHDNAERSTSGQTVHGLDSSGGRWPANLVLTHAAECGADECAPSCAIAALDSQSGESKSKPARVGKKGGCAGALGAFAGSTADADGTWPADPGGGASRFFTVTEWDDVTPFLYTAKPSRRERNADGAVENRHPTVKPLALMRWLVRLVTPPGGTVLEPFAGSGTTLAACVLEGFDAIGCEMTDDYLPIIEGRVAWAQQQTKQDQESLFNQ